MTLILHVELCLASKYSNVKEQFLYLLVGSEFPTFKPSNKSIHCRI